MTHLLNTNSISFIPGAGIIILVELVFRNKPRPRKRENIF